MTDRAMVIRPGADLDSQGRPWAIVARTSKKPGSRLAAVDT